MDFIFDNNHFNKNNRKDSELIIDTDILDKSSNIMNVDYELQLLRKKNDILENKIEKLLVDNSEYKKINKNLSTHINLLINDIDIIKNVKSDLNNDSDYCNNHSSASEDSLKEFFFLLVICEKMKYVNIDTIWMIEPNTLYKEVTSSDIPFYEWPIFLSKRLDSEYNAFLKNKTGMRLNSYSSYSNSNSNTNTTHNNSLIGKMKDLWFDASLNFYNKFKVIKEGITSVDKQNLVNTVEKENINKKINIEQNSYKISESVRIKQDLIRAKNNINHINIFNKSVTSSNLKGNACSNENGKENVNEKLLFENSNYSSTS